MAKLDGLILFVLYICQWPRPNAKSIARYSNKSRFASNKLFLKIEKQKQKHSILCHYSL